MALLWPLLQSGEVVQPDCQSSDVPDITSNSCTCRRPLNRKSTRNSIQMLRIRILRRPILPPSPEPNTVRWQFRIANPESRQSCDELLSPPLASCLSVRNLPDTKSVSTQRILNAIGLQRNALALQAEEEPRGHFRDHQLVHLCSPCVSEGLSLGYSGHVREPE